VQDLLGLPAGVARELQGGRVLECAATGENHTGTISDAAWVATGIELATGTVQGLSGPGGAGGPGFGVAGEVSAGGAVPGALGTRGGSFVVTWKQSGALPSDPHVFSQEPPSRRSGLAHACARPCSRTHQRR
jgi:hypothetical protein